MASKSDPPRNITAASHEVPCSVRWLRGHARRGNIEHVRLPNRHLIFYNKGIKQARVLLYGAAAAKSMNKTKGQ